MSTKSQNRIVHRRSPSERFREAVNYIVREYLTELRAGKDVAMLSAWIEGNKWTLLARVDDARRSQYKVLRDIEVCAKLDIKQTLRYDHELNECFQAMVARRKARQEEQARLDHQEQNSTFKLFN